MTDSMRAFTDFEHRQFVTRTGVRLTLKPLPKLVLDRLYSDQHGKPKVPIVEVTVGGKFKTMQENPDDPDYLEQLAKWEQDKSRRILYYGMTNGIEEDPPQEFVDEYRVYFPGETLAGLKYIWIVSMLGAEGEDVELLSEAIVSQTVATEKGIKSAEDSFQSDGTGTSDQPVPVVEATD